MFSRYFPENVLRLFGHDLSGEYSHLTSLLTRTRCCSFMYACGVCIYTHSHTHIYIYVYIVRRLLFRHEARRVYPTNVPNGFAFGATRRELKILGVRQISSLPPTSLYLDVRLPLCACICLQPFAPPVCVCAKCNRCNGLNARLYLVMYAPTPVVAQLIIFFATARNEISSLNV